MARYSSRVFDSYLFGRGPIKIYLLEANGGTWKGSRVNKEGLLENLITWIEGNEHSGTPHVIASSPQFTRGWRFADHANGEREGTIYTLGVVDTQALSRGEMMPYPVRDIGPFGAGVLDMENKFFLKSKNKNEYIWKFVDNGSVLEDSAAEMRKLMAKKV